MNTIMYGIPNCDTIKKAQKWLNENNISFTFHDYRKDGLDTQLLEQFYQVASWDQLLNKRSTSYRALTEEQKSSLDAKTVNPLFLASPTLIKRPLVIHNNVAIIGFNVNNYQQFFAV
ncbi:ArsC family reductase [Psychromonas sp. SR45-3]|uniref:ArsC family reductase n=1 Tax=Psychromonas sp. SR45-3 TaxID=2760930 RepID=UPI0015FB3FD9|nr:ArsC family reductase [Psychromonas sp. SR45-3]MBB1273006.1 ArsC family reductase [Psychromonas sp. SR45-3]